VGAKTQPDLNLIHTQVDGPSLPAEVGAAMKQFLMAAGKLGGGVSPDR
jgi:hypothetical protein